jgi:hypothetical protein
MLPAIYHRVGRDAKPAIGSSRPIRLAGFRRLHPIVPDWTAFGAAIEGEPHGDQAENQCQPPEHGYTLPTSGSYGRNSGIFKLHRKCSFEAEALKNAPEPTAAREPR